MNPDHAGRPTNVRAVHHLPQECVSTQAHAPHRERPIHAEHPGHPSAGPQPVDVTSLLSELRDARFTSGVVCPRCRSRRVVRWGRFSGRQRFRCRACRRTFSDLTGTPAAYLKRLERLPAYRDCMARCMSIRASARSVSVHPTTAFRWRHRLLTFARENDLSRLSGIVEIEEFWLRRYEPRPRKNRVRVPPRSIFDPRLPRAWLVMLCDRSGHSWIDFPGYFRPNRDEMCAILEMCVQPSATLVTRLGPLSVHAMSARTLGMQIRHARLPAARPADAVLYHTRTARQRVSRLRGWLRQFRGVKPQYLSGYIAWSELLDPDRRGPRMSRLLDWPVPPISYGGNAGLAGLAEAKSPAAM